MEAVLVDTDVFSFFFKGDTRRRAYEPAIANRRLCLALQTYGELRLWGIQRRWNNARIDRLLQVLRHYVIIPYDTDLADCWARITAHRRDLGRPISCGDAWIAAAALRFCIPLITHNGDHYSDIPDLRVVCHAR
ncbi:MAG: PIN domain-containing protein [Acidobacteriota bacterium]